MTGTRSKAMLRRQRQAELELALRLDFKAQPYQMHTACFQCRDYTYCGGRSTRALRCFSCHSKTRAARSRAKRRTKA